MLKTKFASWLWLPYVAPIVLFLALSDIEGRIARQFYPSFYAFKVVLVSLALWHFRAIWREIRWDKRVIMPAVGVGILVFAAWIGIDKAIPYPHLGARTGFNPFAAIENPTAQFLFLAVRFFGLVLMVPLMEELFWRSFLLRYLTQPDFEKLPIGAFSWTSFALVAGAFGLGHSEWLPAIMAAIAYGLLLRATKSLLACIIAHSVTNLCLGIYVLSTGDWKYW
ncbi:MAG TPA: CAAX prenyl protease-related protein [Abditibacterium sp.]|jgi:hypothetical protein